MSRRFTFSVWGTLLEARQFIHNWPVALWSGVCSPQGAQHLLKLRNGLSLSMRSKAGDWTVLREVFCLEIYKEALAYLHGLPGSPTVLDLGGHIGTFSLAAALSHPRASIIACEPAPASIKMFRKNMGLNPELARRITLLEQPVYHTTREVDFFYSTRDSSASSLNPVVGGAEPMRMTTLAFTDLIKRHAPVLVKMDIEGAEYDIIENTVAAVWQDVPVLILEFHQHLVTPRVHEQSLACLASLGFRCWINSEGTQYWFKGTEAETAFVSR